MSQANERGLGSEPQEYTEEEKEEVRRVDRLVQKALRNDPFSTLSQLLRDYYLTKEEAFKKPEEIDPRRFSIVKDVYAYRSWEVDLALEGKRPPPEWLPGNTCDHCRRWEPTRPGAAIPPFWISVGQFEGPTHPRDRKYFRTIFCSPRCLLDFVRDGAGHFFPDLPKPRPSWYKPRIDRAKFFSDTSIFIQAIFDGQALAEWRAEIAQERRRWRAKLAGGARP